MIPEEDTIDWIFDASHYWLESLGGFSSFATGTTIVTPTEENFPVDLELSGHELAQDYFAFAQEHARLTEWPFLLVPDRAPNVADALRGMPHHMTSAPKSKEEPARLEEGDPLTIPYDASQRGEPVHLVATMARGMSHYLLHDAPSELPEADEREYFVDLGAIFLGFGIFLANSSFHFQQTEEGMMVGWGYSRRGALSELDVSYALAVVATLLEVPDREVMGHLKRNPKGFFKSARKHIRKKRAAEVDRLRAIPHRPGGPYR